MFSSNILDVAVGLVFVFLLLSLVSSAASELIERFLKKRAVFLERGIRELAGGAGSIETENFVRAIYNHGLINALYKGTYSTASQNGELPSYIPARNFALAVIDLSNSADKLPLPPNVQNALETFKRVTDAKGEALQQEVENWYNSSMDRVSGWYKRHSQKVVLFLGVTLTILVNADCIQLARRLYTDASAREAVNAIAKKQSAQPDNPPPTPEGIRDNLKTLDGIGLQIGWERPKSWPDFGMLVSGHLVGWLITALAVSLGAPFWFDVLNKFIVIRSTVKPDEKSGPEASKEATKSQTPVIVTLPATVPAPVAPQAPGVHTVKVTSVAPLVWSQLLPAVRVAPLVLPREPSNSAAIRASVVRVFCCTATRASPMPIEMKP